MSRKKYIIWNEPGLNSDTIFACGGCVALRTLFQNLKDLGEDVRLAFKEEQKVLGLKPYKDEDFFSLEEMAIITNSHNLSLEECIAIYPEVTKGNPLECKKVVRWLLHVPDNQRKGVSEYYEKNDILFSFEDWVTDATVEKGFKVEKELLRTLHVDFDIFKDEKEYRHGACHIFKKSQMTDNELIQYRDTLRGSLDVGPYTGDPKVLAKVFNIFDTFYCFDDKSYLSVLAALCGCDSVVISPNESKTTTEQYYESRQNFWRYGVGYSDNIQMSKLYSRANKHLMKSKLIEEQEACLSTVKNFIKFTQEEI